MSKTWMDYKRQMDMIRMETGDDVFFVQIAADDGGLYGLTTSGIVYEFIRPRTAEYGYLREDRTKGGWAQIPTHLYKEKNNE